MSWRKYLLWVAIVAAVAVAATLLGGCGDPEDPCQANPTRTAADGQWVEADGEPLDADPCDADDGDSKKKKKPSKKRRR